jgi:hypothetical protein
MESGSARLVEGNRETQASHGRLLDVLFLALVSVLPALFYLSSLGFYLDDYYELELMSTTDDQSLWGHFTALLSGDPKSHLRPVEYFGLAFLYRLFGTDPLPYQIFLALLVPLCAVAAYLVLRELRQPRFLALGVPILFAAAPHYSSDRFWVVAYSPTASLTLYLISLYSGLRAIEGRGRGNVGWVIAAVTTMLASIFMYEIALPLFVLNALFFWYRARRLGQRDRSVAAAAYASMLALTIATKVVLALWVGTETSYSIGGYQGGLAHHTAYVVSGAMKVNFGTYGIGLPYVLWWIVDNRFSWAVLGASALVATLTFLYLTRGARNLELAPLRSGLRWPAWRELVVAGVLLIAVGYAQFVVTGEIYFSSAGIDNRVNIVAALGVAVLAIGLLLRATAFVPPTWRRRAFALAVALLAGVGVFVTNTLADYWGSAYSRQKDVIARLEVALPQDPSHTTVLLDRICPEIGPGIIFLGHYDLAGALRTAYRDTTLDAGVMTDDITAGRSALVIGTTWLGARETRSYPYRRRLLVYDWRRAAITRLPDADAARTYLAERPRVTCPPRRGFVWGLRTSRWIPFAQRGRVVKTW